MAMTPRWDRFGSLNRPELTEYWNEFVDLTLIPSPIVPIENKRFTHTYTVGMARFEITRTALPVMFENVSDLTDMLNCRGLHFVHHAIKSVHGVVCATMHSFDASSDEYTGSLSFPTPMIDWVVIEEARVGRDAQYPHICPKCGSPAYVGLNQIDCKARCAP